VVVFYIYLFNANRGGRIEKLSQKRGKGKENERASIIL
jgi:hypothetical protein